MSESPQFVQATALVNAYSRQCGVRHVRFDPERIVGVRDVYYTLHGETRLHYDRAYEVRFDARHPICSYVVVGPDGLMNHLQDLIANTATKP